VTAGTRRALRGFICVCALLLVAPAAAQAYVVTVHVHGAGAVTETTSAHLMNCQTPSTANSNLSVSDCVAGSSGGDYAWGWIVTLHASVPSAYASRGWQFQKWVDSSGGGQVNCDPQDQTGDYTNVDCTFQTFSDLAINLYFTDNTGPTPRSPPIRVARLRLRTRPSPSPPPAIPMRPSSASLTARARLDRSPSAARRAITASRTRT
jgi:hypothetical protein